MTKRISQLTTNATPAETDLFEHETAGGVSGKYTLADIGTTLSTSETINVLNTTTKTYVDESISTAIGGISTGAIGYLALTGATTDVNSFIEWTLARNVGSSFTFPDSGDSTLIAMAKNGVYLITLWSHYSGTGLSTPKTEIVRYGGGGDWGDYPGNAAVVSGTDAWPVVSMMNYFTIGTGIHVDVSDAAKFSYAMLQIVQLM